MNPRKKQRTAQVSTQVAAIFRECSRDLLYFIGGPDREDKMQETFARLLMVGALEDIRSPKAYMRRVAMGVCYDWRRKSRRDDAAILFDSTVVEELADSGAISNSGGIDAGYDVREKLAQVLAPLPPVYTRILILVKRDGLSYQEAARETNLSVHTIKKYLFRALQQCRASARQTTFSSG